MTWSSASAVARGSRFPLRPALLRAALPGADFTDTWKLDDLSVPSPTEHGNTDASIADAAKEHATAEAARETALASEREQQLAAARADGLAAGEAMGRASERTRLTAARAAAENALNELRTGESRWLAQLEDNVCALAVAVARQVIGRELKSDPEILSDLLRRALVEFPVDQPVSIRVNPLDLATMNGTLSVDAALPGTDAVAADREARWIADASVVPGGCIVEGRERIIDGRVDSALERVYRRMTGNHA